MFNKPARTHEASDSPRATPLASLIADGVTLKGEIVTAGDIHLDGAVDGDLRVGRLTMGETGRLTGALIADSVEIHGAVRGTIAARQVKLCATARVEGDITHTELAIESGARFDGRSIVAVSEALSLAAE